MKSVCAHVCYVTVTLFQKHSRLKKTNRSWIKLFRNQVKTRLTGQTHHSVTLLQDLEPAEVKTVGSSKHLTCSDQFMKQSGVKSTSNGYGTSLFPVKRCLHNHKVGHREVKQEKIGGSETRTLH